jgi:hypothetical protein
LSTVSVALVLAVPEGSGPATAPIPDGENPSGQRRRRLGKAGSPRPPCSKAIEHLAAAATASSRRRRRRWPVAILFNFSGAPTTPTRSDRHYTSPQTATYEPLKTPPDKLGSPASQAKYGGSGSSVPFRGGHDARGWVVAIRWHGLAHYRRPRPGHGVSCPSPRCLVARLLERSIPARSDLT